MQATIEKRPLLDSSMPVFTPHHHLIKHWVSVLMDEQTPCHIYSSGLSMILFVENGMAELGRLLIYEASRHNWLPTISRELQSPLDVASVEFIDPQQPVVVVPILRAGLALAEHASSVLPATKTYQLGVGRNDETLQRTVYLNKLPAKFSEGTRVLVVDPILATGGTMVTAIDLIKERGVVDNQHIKVVYAAACPPALQKLSDKYPGLHVYAGIIIPTVANIGIIPGLGDAGDRCFGT